MSLDTLIFPALKAASDPEMMLLELKKTVEGTNVESVGRHGKYFWIRFQNGKCVPTVMLMHFGMTGMVKIRDVESHMIFMENGGDKKVLRAKEALKEVKVEDSEISKSVTKKLSKYESDADSEVGADWPPKFTKFELVFENGGKTLDFSFTDPRRLGRVRFLTGPEYATDELLLLQEPLRALGPDYSKRAENSENSENSEKSDESFVFGDPDPCHHGRPRLSLKQFGQLVLSRKKAIKSLLLDQDCFAGIGNWVGDEVLFQARIHPTEILSSKVRDPVDPVIEKLYNAIIFVMEESVRVEGKALLLPEDWLMLHRWGKGRKVKATTNDGYTVDHVTVGGRTSCFVPELQKPLKGEEENLKTKVKSEEGPKKRARVKEVKPRKKTKES